MRVTDLSGQNSSEFDGHQGVGARIRPQMVPHETPDAWLQTRSGQTKRGELHEKIR
jgi:hypothetical protein